MCRCGVFFIFYVGPCMWGFTALHDLVEILVLEGRLREKETDRWERVNWSWHVSSVSVSPDDTWLSPICSCCLVHSLSSTTTTIWYAVFSPWKVRRPYYYELLFLLCFQCQGLCQKRCSLILMCVHTTSVRLYVQVCISMWCQLQYC